MNKRSPQKRAKRQKTEELIVPPWEELSLEIWVIILEKLVFLDHESPLSKIASVCSLFRDALRIVFENKRKEMECFLGGKQGMGKMMGLMMVDMIVQQPSIQEVVLTIIGDICQNTSESNEQIVDLTFQVCLPLRGGRNRSRGRNGKNRDNLQDYYFLWEIHTSGSEIDLQRYNETFKITEGVPISFRKMYDMISSAMSNCQDTRYDQAALAFSMLEPKFCKSIFLEHAVDISLHPHISPPYILKDNDKLVFPLDFLQAAMKDPKTIFPTLFHYNRKLALW